MANTFKSLGVDSFLVKGLKALAIATPTDIQTKVIPVVLNQMEDVVGIAKTGTGKTAAFGLPLLQKIDVDNNDVQAIVLAPTRELGQQIYKNLADFAKFKPEISITATCGGIPIKPQIERLKEPTHIIVATPGRLIDLMERKAVAISNASYLVIDEADEMVTILKEGLDTILKGLPNKRRTFLFTATLSGEIKQLVQNYLAKKIVHIEVDMATLGHQGIDHQYVVVQPEEKLNVLMHFLSSKDGQRGIIFCKTKAAVNKLAKKLAINKYSSGALHGSLSQPIRDRIMDQFRAGHINILVATDLAARGAKGLSLSVIQQDEVLDIPELEDELGITFSEMPKADAWSIEENNAKLWAKQIFKTKPNQHISEAFKTDIKTIFHHLTKEELMDKLIAHHLGQPKTAAPNEDDIKKKKKKKR